MTFLDKLNQLMASRGLNRSTLSKACGIPYTTIDGWYKRGYEGLKVSTLKKVSDFFDVSMEYWLDAEEEDYGVKKEAPAPMERELTLKQQQIVGLIPFIPEKIQDAILAICEATADRSAAAGFGFYHDPDYIQSARDNTDPADNSEEHSG